MEFGSNCKSKALDRVKGLREGRRRRVPDDTPVFKDWADKRKVYRV